MIKKEKILHSYITNIIEDENPKKIFILTSQDVSKLIKRIEKLSVNGLSIGPDIGKLSDENFDLFIILDDINASESNIGTIKNLLSHKIAIFTNFEDDQETNEVMLKLGFQTELIDKNNKLKCFSYNLKTYNNKRTWNNPKGWANPENFDKFRW